MDPIALILAAGFGKRLGSLTENTPKPLVSLNGGKLIDCALFHLKQAGILEVTINLHYLGSQIQSYLGDGSGRGMKIHYSEEDPILDTGGAIKKVLGENPERDILVYNSDAAFGKDFELRQAISVFSAADAPAALMVLREAPGSNEYGAIRVSSDSPVRVARILDTGLGQDISLAAQEYMFTGVHIFSSRTLSYMESFGDIFSSTRDLYPKLLQANELIVPFMYSGYWQDTGTAERLDDARKAVQRGDVLYDKG